MSSREETLSKIRGAQHPCEDVQRPDSRRHVVPVDDTSREALQTRFIEEATKLRCDVHLVNDSEAAIEKILEIIGDDQAVVSWSFDKIPVKGLQDALAQSAIEVISSDEPNVRVGLTGAAAGLAATGSLVMVSGAGKNRKTSLLPSIHVAVVTSDQLVPDFESWMLQQREIGLEHFREASNTVLISGPSRTADIGKILVMGAHGPLAVHIILISVD